jgi:hypothetical protein
MFAHLPAYRSWFGNTLASGGAIAWTNNTITGITEPVGITYNSSDGSFKFSNPGLYFVSFNSHKTVFNPGNYIVAIYLDGSTVVEKIGSSSNSGTNFCTVDMNTLIRITSTTQYLQIVIDAESQSLRPPNEAYLSISWFGL